jgi:hypothetical protein
MLVLAGVFVVALAIVIGKRMSPDAMAVVVGVVCGIGASIPTSLLMLFLLSRRNEAESQAQEQRQTPPMPQVMIVSPPASMMQPYFGQPQNAYLPPLPAGGPRHFQILGADDYGDEGGRYTA